MSRTKHSYSDYRELSHTFTVSGPDDFGYSNSHRMSYNGYVVKSYSSRIARKFPEEKVLLIDKYYMSYSNTTTNQIYALRHAFNHWKIITVHGEHDKLISAQKQCKKDILEILKCDYIIKKYSVPRDRYTRANFSETYDSYLKLQEITKKELFTDAQLQKVKVLNAAIGVYNDICLEREKERCKKREEEHKKRQQEIQRINNLAMDMLHERAGDDLKFTKDTPITTIINNYKYNWRKFESEINDFLREQYKETSWLSYHEWEVKLLEIKELTKWYEDNEVPYNYTNYRENEFVLTRNYEDKIRLYDYIMFDENGDIVTNHQARINRDQTKAVYLMAKYYVESTDTFEQKQQKLQNKHCGPFTIGDVCEKFIRVGCHFFTMPMVKCFIQDYETLYGDKI